MTVLRRDVRALVIGEVFVDYHLDLGHVRLGGIGHAARALHATGVEWAAGYIAPTYLEAETDQFLAGQAASAWSAVGRAEGAPNLIVIRDSPESGSQGYDDVLRDNRRITLDVPKVREFIAEFDPTDVLVFPGSFSLADVVLACAGRRVSIDAQYALDLPAVLESANSPCDTVFCSTSSPLFRDEARGSVANLAQLLPQHLTSNIILKENRGGSRLLGQEEADAGAYLATTVHSVGVGDCFDVVWMVADPREPGANRLNRASYIAHLYAGTHDDHEFDVAAREALSNDATVLRLRGKRLPWEDRSELAVYIAAPDFPHVDTRSIDELEEALAYHNFKVVRPIRDHGLVDEHTSPARRQEIYRADVDALVGAAVVIAVPIIPDEGTFVEVGIAARSGTPVVLYDVLGATRNMFAVETANSVCRTRADVITAVFSLLARTAA